MRPGRLVFVGAVIALLTACSALRDYHTANPDFGSSMPPYERIQFASQFATPTERDRCEAAGGIIQQAGRLGWQHCVQTFADAGEACSGSADCLGDCRLAGDAGSVAPDTPVQGVCQTNDAPFGCYTTVENGKVGLSICVD
ncbi:hypothetical protein [uncultured Hyphomonas sp.]|uniref:hypothetical protein n=1 Tax=uncultured Hyphomonas sp. TaxID=225298 RepID=UPI002AAC3C36|nr:hypothetical protein [uncultured Hyphomonas sp.]